MTSNPLFVHATTLLVDAQKLMIEKQLRHLPVVDGEKIMGVVSDRDIYLAQVTNRELDDFSGLQIGDVCSLGAYTVPASTPLASVVLEMAQRHIGSALIVDNDKLTGIFTATDACKQLGKLLQLA